MKSVPKMSTSSGKNGKKKKPKRFRSAPLHAVVVFHSSRLGSWSEDAISNRYGTSRSSTSRRVSAFQPFRPPPHKEQPELITLMGLTSLLILLLLYTYTPSSQPMSRKTIPRPGDNKTAEGLFPACREPRPDGGGGGGDDGVVDNGL